MLQRQATKPSPTHQPDVPRETQAVAVLAPERYRWPELQRAIGNQAAARLLLRQMATTGAFRGTSANMSPAAANLVLQRKCACGGIAAGPSGECEECSKKKIAGWQTKLRISEPGDIYEQEADQAARQVMLMPDDTAMASAALSEQKVSRVQRMCSECAEEPLQRSAKDDEEEERLQMRPVKLSRLEQQPGQAAPMSPAAEAQIESLRGGGEALSEPLR